MEERSRTKTWNFIFLSQTVRRSEEKRCSFSTLSLLEDGSKWKNVLWSIEVAVCFILRVGFEMRFKC